VLPDKIVSFIRRP